MNDLKFREAVESDFCQIYMMGFDVWSIGSSQAEYLEGCRTSPKYKKGKWFVLSKGDDLLSSLIAYDFGKEIAGIGSIATSENIRKQGYASKLISEVILHLEEQRGITTLFLYADISPAFYERFGFVRLPQNSQKYPNSICMVRSKANTMIEPELIPKYF